MLTADALLIGPAGAGLAGMLAQGGGMSSLGIAAVGLAALFLALVAGLSPAAAPEEAEDAPQPGQGGGLDRRALIACAAVLGAIGVLTAAVTVAIWTSIGLTHAFGMGVVALAFLVLGGAAGLRALRRRAR